MLRSLPVVVKTVLRTVISLLILLTTVAILPCFGQQEENAVPSGTRAKEFAFYGTQRSDWVQMSAASATAPLLWKILKNPAPAGPGQAQLAIVEWGIGSDSITPGSWSGDVFYDPGIWRAGTKWTLRGETPTIWDVTHWGQPGDSVARDGDYDGDGKLDHTAIRTVSAVQHWWIKLSSTGETRVVQFGRTITGQTQFIFRGADFTGDGRDELVIARVNNTNFSVVWFVADAVNGALVAQVPWGNFNDQYIIQPADYTGDGRADFVTWAGGSNAVWWILNSANGVVQPAVIFGIPDPAFENNDIAIRGDYDGDGIHDRCVWRPATSTFFCLSSIDQSFIVQQWGAPTDTPLASFFTF